MSSVKHGDHELTHYRGLKLRVNNQSITILCSEGKKVLGEVPSMSSARAFVRGYQRA